jgi:hypothetical protein
MSNMMHMKKLGQVIATGVIAATLTVGIPDVMATPARPNSPPAIEVCLPFASWNRRKFPVVSYFWNAVPRPGEYPHVVTWTNGAPVLTIVASIHIAPD